MNDLKGIIKDCNKSDLVSDKIIKKIIEIIGQEEWQDLHDENNDICTTMGELIITLNGVADLEKENAELKERLKEHESVGDVQFWENVWSWKIKAIHLTKAKEIIKRLLVVVKNHLHIADVSFNAVINDAEKILKEE